MKRLKMRVKVLSGPTAWWTLIEKKAKANGETVSGYLMRLGLVDCGRGDLVEKRPTPGSAAATVTASQIVAARAEGKTMAEIAAEHGCSVRALYRRLDRAGMRQKRR